LSPKVFGYHSAGQTYPYDLNKARALLAEAGYTDRFETTISTFDRRDRVKVAEVIRSQLKGIGIDAKINVLGYTDFVELITKTKTHDLFISGWGNATGDADYNQYNLFHTIGGGDGNSFMYSNGELDRLIERGRVEKDPAKRRDIYARAQEWELREALFVPIRNQENLTAVNKHVQGFSISPAGYFMLRQVAIQE
jgi:peptide/nickel transport system substrate-binding protein